MVVGHTDYRVVTTRYCLQDYGQVPTYLQQHTTEGRSDPEDDYCQLEEGEDAEDLFPDNSPGFKENLHPCDEVPHGKLRSFP